jgi:pentatricopeptide repeat protein
MLTQTNITLKKGLHSKLILNHFHYIKRGFDGGNVRKQHIYHYFTTSKNFNNDKKLLLYTKRTPNILSMGNFLMRKFSTEISKDTSSNNETILNKNDLSDLNNKKIDTLIGKSSNSFNSLDINKFIYSLKNGKINEAKSLILTQDYCTTIDNIIEFKNSLIQHLDFSDAELLNKANDILSDQFIQVSLKFNLHKSDPQVLNLYDELSNKGIPEPYLGLFCVNFLSIIMSRNFELSPPKHVILEFPINIDKKHLETFTNLLKGGDLEGAKTFLKTNNYATTIHDTLEFSDSLRYYLNSNQELYNMSDRFLKEYLRNNLVPTQELEKFIQDYNQYSLTYYIKKSYSQQVLSRYEDLLKKDFIFSDESKLAIFCAYIKSNDDNSALKFFISNISSSSKFSLSDFKKTVQPLLNELEYDKVQEILRHYYIQQISPNTKEITSYVTKIFSNKDQTTKTLALNLYEKLCKLGIPINSITYGAFIMGFLSQDRYNEAEFIYNDMIKRGHKPTQVIYSGMLDGFSRRRVGTKKVIELWNRMLADEIQPDEIAYCAMIETYFINGNIENAIKLFQQMSLDQNIKLNDIVYNRIINGLLLNDRVDESMIIYDQMKKREIFPNIITYNTLINKLFDKKKEQHAMKILQDMQQFNIKPNVTTLTILLKIQFQNRNIDGIQKVLNMFDSLKIKPNVQTYGTLISGLLNDFNDLNSAESAFNEMIYKHGLSPTVHIYTNLIQGYINHGKFQLAEQLYFDLLQNKILPTTATFNILIGGYSKVNNLDKAKQYYNEMIRLGVKPTSSTYKILINGYFASKNMFDASQIYDDMLNVEFIPKDVDLKRFCQVIVQWRSRQSNINQVLKEKK